jgi:ribose 1,5-bisphosphokinase
LPDGVRCKSIDNSGELEDAGHALIAFLEAKAGL